MMSTQEVEGCEGDLLTLSVSQGGFGDLNWTGPGIVNPALATQTITLTQDTFYNVTISLAPGCEGSEEINVNVFPTFTESNGFLCPGIDSVLVDGIWYNEVGQTCETMTSFYNCDSTHCVTIEAIDTPLVNLEAEIFIEEGEEFTLEATGGFSTYQWSPPDGLSCDTCSTTTVLHEVEGEYLYTLTVTDENECESNLFTLVTVWPPCMGERLKIPNVFTPDSDGFNDSFGVPEFEGFEMISTIRIYNRWGEKVFEDVGVDAKWDGTQDGKPAPTDTYVYIIQVECDEGIGILEGDITLIR